MQIVLILASAARLPSSRFRTDGAAVLLAVSRGQLCGSLFWEAFLVGAWLLFCDSPELRPLEMALAVLSNRRVSLDLRSLDLAQAVLQD